MRYSLLLLSLAAVGLNGCVAGGSPSSQQSLVTSSTDVQTVTYMSPERSATLIILPGDTTTPVQLRFLSAPPMSEADNRQPDEGILKAAGL
jgi:outer membrane lipoprotein SlyB